MSEQTVIYHYKPANEGDHLTGVPRRDITVLDLASLTSENLRDMLSPGPSGKPMYRASKGDSPEATHAQELQEGYQAAAEAEAAALAGAADASGDQAAAEAAAAAAKAEADKQAADASAAAVAITAGGPGVGQVAAITNPSSEVAATAKTPKP